MESKQWAPSRWSPDKIRLFLRHVDEHGEGALVGMCGYGLACVLMAQVRAEYASALSVTIINERGVKTMGQS